VIVHGRRAYAVNAVVQAISADGGPAEGLTADLADPGDCAWLVSRALWRPVSGKSACSRPGMIVSATLPTRHWMWPWRSAAAPGSLGSRGSRPEAPAGWLRCRQGANFSMAAGVTGVKKLTRLPSGSRNRSERLPHGIVVGSLTKSSTNPARF
jgi:hypothetical protein